MGLDGGGKMANEYEGTITYIGHSDGIEVDGDPFVLAGHCSKDVHDYCQFGDEVKITYTDDGIVIDVEKK